MDKLETPLLPNAPAASTASAEAQPTYHGPAAPVDRFARAILVVMMIIVAAATPVLFMLMFYVTYLGVLDYVHAEQDAAHRSACEVQVATRMYGSRDTVRAADCALGLEIVRVARTLRDFESQVYWCVRNARV